MYQEYKLIGFCISKLHEKSNRGLVEAINNALVPLGYRLLIFHTSTDLYRSSLNDSAERTIFDLIPYENLDGLIIHDESFFDKWAIQCVINKAQSYHLPVLNIGAKKEGCYNILFQEDEGFAEVVRHLIEVHGKKNIYMIGGYKGNYFCDNRERIFCEVMAEHNLPCPAEHIFYGNLWETPTVAATEEILKENPLPEAIVCVNDFTALTVSDTLRAHNIRIPDDILITGFDGMDEAKYAWPSITTCKCDYNEVARVIAEILTNIEKMTTTASIIRVPYQQIHASSCGCGKDLPFSDVGGMLRASESRLSGYIDFEGHLYELADKLVLCQDRNEQVGYLSELRVSDMMILLNDDFYDVSINPVELHREDPYNEKLFVVYESNVMNPEVGRYVSPNDLIPNMDELLDRGVPLVLNALSYLGNTLGYVCFYCEPLQANYCHLVQYVTMLNQAFGGAKNFQYLQHVAENMETLSEEDFMTGLNNRKGFFKKLPGFLTDCTSEPIVLYSIDLDGLKYINDTYGHTAGDVAIKMVADAIERLSVRHALSARFGGDEFILVISKESNIEPDDIIASIQTNLLQEQISNDLLYDVTASIGYVVSDAKSFNFEEISKEADARMYIIKQSKPHHR